MSPPLLNSFTKIVLVGGLVGGGYKLTNLVVKKQDYGCYGHPKKLHITTLKKDYTHNR